MKRIQFLLWTLSLSINAPAVAVDFDAVVTIIDTSVISQQPSFYHGWPTVARCANGDLRVVYSGGRDYHICPFGRLEMIVSQDDGTTWTLPRVLEDSIIDDRDAGIMETHLYVDGGITIQRFLQAGLVDEVSVTVIPIIPGKGRPLVCAS